MIAAGEAIGFSSGGAAKVWPVVLVGTGFVACVGFSRQVRMWPLLFFLMLGAVLAMRAVDNHTRILSAIRYAGNAYEGDFTVWEDPKARSFVTRYPGGKLIVIIPGGVTNAPPPKVGEVWRCRGWFTQKDDDWKTPSLWVTGRTTFATRVKEASSYSPHVVLARIKRSLSQRIGVGLEEQPMVANLNRAMVLGMRASLPHDLKQDFIRSGTMHVFAISGLHVMVIAGILLFALRLGLSARWAGFWAMPLLWGYVVLIGSSASAVRAAAMASICLTGPLVWRRPNGLIAWELTFIGFAVLDPVGFFGVGSLLSFAVMLGILLFLRWAEPMKSRLLMTVGVPLSAWLAGVPIVAHVFARVTPGGLMANFAMVPLAFCAVMTSALGMVASFISEGLATHVNNLAALFTRAMTGISWAVARIPGSDMEIVPWSIGQCALWYAGVILVFLWAKAVWRRRRASLA